MTNHYVVNMIPISNIIVEERLREDLGNLKILGKTISVHGLLNPITVFRRENKYVLVAGERRLRVCQQLEWHTIPAHILPKSEMFKQ